MGCRIHNKDLQAYFVFGVDLLDASSGGNHLRQHFDGVNTKGYRVNSAGRTRELVRSEN